MALETIVYPQSQIGYNYNLGGYDYVMFPDQDHMTTTFGDNYHHQSAAAAVKGVYSCNSLMHAKSSSSPDSTQQFYCKIESTSSSAGRRKRRRRTKSGKNKEELENQRMTHITVERNRRKQMNEYLAVIRSLIPSSYVQRGDQASIVGGAINFVKELEQQLQTLEVQKRANLGDFFKFPQYSIINPAKPAMAEIQVTLVESQANLKILSKKRHRQLFKLVAGLKCCWLTVLHLNVTTVEEILVLYTLSLKLEDGCQLNTVDDIADAINCLLGRIEEESICSS